MYGNPILTVKSGKNYFQNNHLALPMSIAFPPRFTLNSFQEIVNGKFILNILKNVYLTKQQTLIGKMCM